jgi:hypothetical protein
MRPWQPVEKEDFSSGRRMEMSLFNGLTGMDEGE